MRINLRHARGKWWRCAAAPPTGNHPLATPRRPRRPTLTLLHSTGRPASVSALTNDLTCAAMAGGHGQGWRPMDAAQHHASECRRKAPAPLHPSPAPLCSALRRTWSAEGEAMPVSGYSSPSDFHFCRSRKEGRWQLSEAAAKSMPGRGTHAAPAQDQTCNPAVTARLLPGNCR